ncbi:iron chelate uptake ABC transporter family permease subunit [Sphingomonas sp. LR61]|uniref:iron chelate uptake ABC transporter family permease subunit n=1 Tax=Sphingomonas sp. LR61 TaxID=3050234 RepID=UPI002FE39F65
MTAVVLGVTIKGRLAPELMILVGIAVAAFLGAADDILLNRAALEAAEAAKVWQFGSLNIVSWPAAWPLLIILTLLLLSAPFLSRPIRALELGDDTAVSFGLHVARVRLTLTAGGVLLVAAVVAAVGPIGFIALRSSTSGVMADGFDQRSAARFHRRRRRRNSRR